MCEEEREREERESEREREREILVKGSRKMNFSPSIIPTIDSTLRSVKS